MNVLNKLISYFFISSVLVVSFVHAIIPKEDLINSDVALKPGYEYMSPALGYFLSNTKLLENIRFSEFVKKGNKRLNDTGIDPLSHIAVQLFPSVNGAISATDLIKEPTEIASLLNAITYLRLSQEGGCSIYLGSSDMACHKHRGRVSALNSASFCKKYYDAMQNILGSNIKKSLKKNIISYFDSEQANLYPQYFLEQVIWAFAIKRFNSKNDLNEILKGLDSVVIDKNKIDTPLDPESKNYASILSKIVELSGTSKEQLVPYTSANEVINSGYAYLFNRSTGEIETSKFFPDCGETVIRHLFNIALYDQESNSFDLTHIKKLHNNLPNDVKQKHPLTYLLEFYQNPEYTFENCVFGSNYDIRSAWNKVTADIEKVSYDRPEIYHNSNLNTSDADLINTLSIILNTQVDPNLSIEEQYHKLLKVMNPKKDVIFEKDESIRDEFTHYLIKISDKKLLTLRTSLDHADIEVFGSLHESEELQALKAEYRKDENILPTLACYFDNFSHVFDQYRKNIHPFFKCFIRNSEERKIDFMKSINWIQYSVNLSSVSSGSKAEDMFTSLVIASHNNSNQNSKFNLSSIIFKALETNSEINSKAVEKLFSINSTNNQNIKITGSGIGGHLVEIQNLHYFNVKNNTSYSFGPLVIDANRILNEKLKEGVNPYKNISYLHLTGNIPSELLNDQRTIDLSKFEKLEEIVISKLEQELIFSGTCPSLKKITLVHVSNKCLFRDLDNDTINIDMLTDVRYNGVQIPRNIPGCEAEHFSIRGLDKVKHKSVSLRIKKYGNLNIQELPYFIANENVEYLMVNAGIKTAFNGDDTALNFDHLFSLKKLSVDCSYLEQLDWHSKMPQLEELQLISQQLVKLAPFPPTLKKIHVQKKMYDNSGFIQEALNNSELQKIEVINLEPQIIYQQVIIEGMPQFSTTIVGDESKILYNKNKLNK